MTKNNIKTNWFAKNRSKTFLIIFLFVLLVFGLIRIVVPKKKHNIVTNPGRERFIRLREHPPLLHKTIYPSEKYMKLTEGLVRQDYLLRVDDNGFIMPSKRHPQPDLAVVFLGGSTTECLLLEEENRFPYLVGKILEEKTGKKVNSYNGGVGGNNSLHSLDILLNKVIPLKPDIVVLSHNINDLFIILAYGEGYWNHNPFRSPIIITPEKEFYLTNKLKKTFRRIFKKEPEVDEFQHLRGKKIKIDPHRLVSEFTTNLQMFIQISHLNHMVPVLMTQSNRFKPVPDEFTKRYMQTMETDYGINYSEFKASYDLINQTIRNIAKDNNVLLIDLALAVLQEKEFLYDILHYNEHGSRLAAQIISEKLLANIK